MQARAAVMIGGVGFGSWEITIIAGQLLLAYLLGSMSGSLLLGRLRGLDIRQHGSGNAGGTNALRVAGWKFALVVVVIDIGKGTLAALVGAWQPGPNTLDAEDQQYVIALCGFAAVFGHCWPVFFGFRGGKGAGTAVGAILVIAPMYAAMIFLVWLSVIAATRYVGLATICAGLAFPCLVVGAGYLNQAPSSGLLPFALAIALLLVFTHRGNLRRMLRNEEPKLGRPQKPA